MPTVFLYLCLTGYASFPRYEAYLVFCVVALTGLLVAKFGKALFTGQPQLTFWVTTLTCTFLALPLVLRSFSAFTQINKDSVNTYMIQNMAGDFLKTYYPDVPIVAEALGGVSYFADGKKLDVVGLGDIAVARAMKGGYYTVDFLDSLSKQEGIKLAVASEYSTPAELLNRWKRVASWHVPLERGGYYVSFYAVDAGLAPGLKKNLVEYEKMLPQGERAIYY